MTCAKGSARSSTISIFDDLNPKNFVRKHLLERPGSRL